MVTEGDGGFTEGHGGFKLSQAYDVQLSVIRSSRVNILIALQIHVKIPNPNPNPNLI